MIYNLGSINIDRVYTLDHFVAPGETEAADAFALFPGGKGFNQSIALARAGAPVTHIGAIGPDGEGLRDYLRTAGVCTAHLRTVPTETGHAVILVDRAGANAIIVTPGANGTITPAHVRGALRDARPDDVLLTQNETATGPEAIALAREAGLRTIFNPSPFNARIADFPLALVDLFLLNETEAAALTTLVGPGLPPDAAPETLLEVLRRGFPEATFVLTRGAAGAWLAEPGAAPLFSPAFPADAVDTTAAGDTFTGFFLAARAANSPYEAALRRANAAAAIAVSRAGAAPSVPTAAEVDALLAEAADASRAQDSLR